MLASIATANKRKTPASAARPFDASFLILPLFLLGFLLARFAAPIFALLPSCTFRAAVGLPCPSCGATRAGLALARGELLTAFAYNPLFVVGLGILLLWSVWQMLERGLGKTIKFEILPRRRLRGLVSGMIILNWLYLIVSD
jgi:hypothetical protein